MIRRLIVGIVSSLFIVLFTYQPINVHATTSLVNYDKIIPAAKKYMNIPYRYGGTAPTGFDCSGYIQYVYNEAGIKLPRTTVDMYRVGQAVSKANLRVGDLVFFNTTGRIPSHAGIYIGDNEFIHSSSSKGISISNLNDPYYWGKKYIGARRVLSYPLAQGQFKDINTSYWAHHEIKTLANNDIVQGYQGSYFKPHDTITRAEVAALLAKSFDLPMSNRKQTFKDVPTNHWAVGAINALHAKGIMNGDNNGNFRPNDRLTRAQLSKVLVEAFHLQKTTATTFTDVPSTHWANDYVNQLAASGITTGYDDGSFRPETKVNRAQFATFLYRGL
ncbi:C40 family peptidase [Bacillus sp. CGMCC 1.16541]|uniref:C40 family peptidase n=1 Tax=Bacillus sp. CGMCC 1.16541 TaxID=2185143 RepID=UPI000D729D04|nr:C40 family peptidase [Bacillus sp. CGMCC 1.16541]